MKKLYRVQDKYGRGPFRPGFTCEWLSHDKDYNSLPPWWVEFDIDINKIAGLPKGYHLGSGCWTMEKLILWFNDIEMKILKGHGFKLIELVPDLVIAQSDIQVLFGQKEPLHKFY